jgi:hypothetical protein
MVEVKKFVAGLLVGILLMCGIAVAGQIIAEQVDYKILVNGKQVQLAKQPVSIDDSTYLPLRAVAELVGYDVGFDGNSNTISLNAKIPTQQPQTTVPSEKKIINSSITFNGQKLDINTVLVYNGEYYCKARELRDQFNFKWDWDTTNRVFIFTSSTGEIGKTPNSEQLDYDNSVYISMTKLLPQLGYKMTVTQSNDTGLIDITK